MDKGAGNTSPLSAFRWLSFYYVFFKSKEKYVAKTSVMADLFTLTYNPPPPPHSRVHITEAKFLVPDRGDKVDFGKGLWLVEETIYRAILSLYPL